MNEQDDSPKAVDTAEQPSAESLPRVRIGPRVNHEKKTAIRLQKNGSTVESIKVICACGEEITIQCRYSDAA